MNRRIPSTFAALMLLGALLLPLHAAEPEPAPTSGNASAPAPNTAAAVAPDADAMRAAFVELGHDDAGVRRRALEKLMGIGRGNLDAFRQIVEQSRPLLPSQAAALQQIVYQAYLSGEPYEAVPQAGFLGVRMQVVTVTSPLPRHAGPGAAPAAAAGDAGAEFGIGGRQQVGIVIVERMPGFCGAQMLIDGDLILSVVGQPLRLTDDRDYRAILDDFSQAVREVGAGNTVTFELLRQGRVTRVSVRLDPRPQAADAIFGGGNGEIDQLLNRRRQKADAYWGEAFRPLLSQGVG